MGSIHPLHYVIVCKIHGRDDTFKLFNLDILFLYKLCWLLGYNMFCSRFDTNMAPIPCTTIFSRYRIIANPAGIYLFQVNNRYQNDTKHRSGVFVNFEEISHIVLVFSLLTLIKKMSARKCERKKD